MPDRRFRDMSLTEEEASRRAYTYIFDYYQTVPPYRASRYLNILARAKRLLPLWRKWGLRDAEEDVFIGVGHMTPKDYSRARMELLKQREKRRKP